MADDIHNAVANRNREADTSVTDRMHLQGWADALGCTVEVLRAAVRAVGPEPAKVASYINELAAHVSEPSG